MKPSRHIPKTNGLIPFVIITLLVTFSLNVQAGTDITTAFPIPDTGQTTCYDLEKEIPYPEPGEDFYGQDGNYLINPPSYTKLDKNGNDLPVDAQHWVMVRDNVTGLIWEVKTDDGSVHDRDNEYIWYDYRLDDENPGIIGRNVRKSGDETNVDFIATLNAEMYGGYVDWRLPSIQELYSIECMNQFFPNSMNATYWSSTYCYYTGGAWGVNFWGNSVDLAPPPYPPLHPCCSRWTGSVI
jgi:hypothetical protein